MNKKEVQDLTNDVLIADALIRIKALENILISKGIITNDELINESSVISDQITKSILKNAKLPIDIDEAMKSLKDIKNDN